MNTLTKKNHPGGKTGATIDLAGQQDKTILSQDSYVQELIASAPALTSDQTQTIARILGGR